MNWNSHLFKNSLKCSCLNWDFEISKLALAILDEGTEPKLFLIPSEDWKHPNRLLVSRDYEGKKSKPEWGLNLSCKNMDLLEQYSFDLMIDKLKEK